MKADEFDSAKRTLAGEDVLDHPSRYVLRLRSYSAAGPSTTFNSRVKEPKRKASSL